MYIKNSLPQPRPILHGFVACEVCLKFYYEEARHVNCKALMQNRSTGGMNMLDALKNEGCNYNQYMCEHQFR